MNRGVTSLLLNRMAAGDPIALSALYELTVHRVYGVAMQILKSKKEAQSVVCDTYVFVWDSASTLKEQADIGLEWLLDIVNSRATERAQTLARLRRPRAHTHAPH